jgi:hypothetical protein
LILIKLVLLLFLLLLLPLLLKLYGLGFIACKSKAVPQHAMKALGGRESIAPTHLGFIACKSKVKLSHNTP